MVIVAVNGVFLIFFETKWPIFSARLDNCVQLVLSHLLINIAQ